MYKYIYLILLKSTTTPAAFFLNYKYLPLKQNFCSYAGFLDFFLTIVNLWKSDLEVYWNHNL